MLNCSSTRYNNLQGLVSQNNDKIVSAVKSSHWCSYSNKRLIKAQHKHINDWYCKILLEELLHSLWWLLTCLGTPFKIRKKQKRKWCLITVMKKWQNYGFFSQDTASVYGETSLSVPLYAILLYFPCQAILSFPQLNHKLLIRKKWKFSSTTGRHTWPLTMPATHLLS